MALLSKKNVPHNRYHFAKTSPPEETKEKFQAWTCQMNRSLKIQNKSIAFAKHC